MRAVFANRKPTIKEICSMCTGRLNILGVSEDETVSGMCTDSREAEPDTLFVAIKGERVDGHDYILSAAKRGCCLALAERVPDMCGADKYAIIVVDDVLLALERIAFALKNEMDCLTVGITGSVGKTTTKEFVYAVLKEHYKTYKTAGNHNSVIGMPISVIEMPRDTEAAVFEMGMSGVGEIASMTRAARPNIAIITTVGTSHIEMLGSRENICLAKMEIAEGLCENGTLVLNGDEPLLVSADKKGHRVIYVGIENRNADYRALNIRTGINKTTFDLLCGGRIYSNIELPVMGHHNVYAALFAFAVGRLCHMDGEEIRRGLLSYKSVGMRQNIYQLGGITLIEDCYNASPESMRSALDVLSQLSEQKGGARTAALLGDMLELGENSPALHREVGTYAAKKGCSLLFTYGERAKSIALSAIEKGMNPENVYVNPNTESPQITGEMLLHALRYGDILLVKASRSIAAERIIDYLKKNFEKLPK